LEIGTHLGDTISVFLKYFDGCNIDGKVITTDIKVWGGDNDTNPSRKARRKANKLDTEKRVKSILVYPHTGGVECLGTMLPVEDSELLPNYKDYGERSIGENIKLITAEMDKMGITLFDFAFIDGDHLEESVEKDWKIALALTKPPHYMLFDDVLDPDQACSKFYDKILKPDESYEKYDFSDWGIATGTALVHLKEC
jgi:hypothetical protein